MKRFFFSLLAVCALCLLLALPALADGPYIFDDTGLSFTSEQSQQLNAQAAEISQRYGCGVYAAILQNWRTYSSDSIRSAATEIYNANGFGFGDSQSGVFLVVSLYDREAYIVAQGYGSTAVTDYGREKMLDIVTDYFSPDDWYGGISAYIQTCGDYLEKASNGNPVDVTAGSSLRDALGFPGMFFVIVIIPCLIALIACSIMKRQMVSAVKAKDAKFFAVPRSLNIYESADTFSHITESRVKIESDRSGGGRRGGGTTIGSDGFSGSGRKF